ncbi:QRICH2 [Branchiostoma lanceolatum]|uniref:QRICH2 protein n=1 Tax=Branchiostoma lanceolatum TaxID=7740 RepID=A0A8J9ZF70_BRALA|nr:QRICH2 [Branchiostoma lanceolatum]
MTSPHPSPNIVITSFIRVDGERQARYAAEETFRKVQAEYSELRGVIDDINGQIDASRERLRLIKYEHNEEKRHLQSRLGDDAGSDRSGGSYTHYSRDLYSYRRRDTHSREHHDYDSSANKRRLFEMMASVEMEVSELQRVRREIVRQQELVRTLHIDIHTLQFREDELRKVANDTDKRHGREVDIRDNVVTKLQQEVATATDQLLQQKFQNQQLLDDAMLLDAQLKTYRRLWDLSEGRDPPGDLFPPVRDDEETTLGTSGRRPLALPAPPSMPAGRTWGALTKMDTTVTPGYAPPPIKRDYGITTRTGASTTRISYVTSAAARKTTSRTSTDQDDAPGGKFAKIEVRGQTTRKDTTPTLTATQTIRIGPPKNPGESGFIHQVSRTDQDQVDTSAAVTMETSGGSFSGQSIASQTAGVAYGQVASLVPQVEQQERIMVTVTEGKVTGAKQLKSGQTKELSPIETQQIMASIPAETAQKSGNIMVTVTEGQVVETKAVTEKEAETIVSLVTEEGDPTAEKVVVSVEGGQVVGKRVGKDKATPLSPQEAAQLWRSVAQPGQQTGDVVVSLKQGQIVGSQQLTATEAETIKAVVVEEPKPTVCVTPGQPAFTSIVPTPAQLVAPQKDKIMVTVTNGKVSGAKRLKSGDTKELSPLETQQIMASVPTETAQQSGNIMVTVTEGKVIETKQVTTKEAETIVSLVSEEPDPTAEKVVVSLEAGQVVGKRVGKDKATPLSPQEAAQLWRSVAQPGQQTGDVVVSLKQGQIVGSQQLTPTEAETIKSVVTQEAQAMQVIQTSQQVQPGGSITLQQPGVFGAVQTTQVFSSGVQTGGMVAPGTVAPGTVAPRTEAPGIVAPGTLPFGTVASGTVPLGSVAPGTVAPGIVAPGIVAPGTVAPGTIPLGTVAPGTVAPATQAPGMVAPGTVPFGTVASGTVPLGSVAPGTVAPGIVAAGTVAAGTIPHGSVAPGTVAPGTVAPGTVVPGTVAPGTVTFGTVATGTVAPGTVAFGTVAPGTVAPGAAPLGSVALGTVAPGTVAPGTVAPRTGAPGIVAPGTVPFGTVASGTVPLGSVVPGTVAPGTAAFGTVAPGIVVPGTVAPGTGAIVTGTVTESGSVSTGTVAPGGVAPAPGTTTASAQIQEYLPPFARHPLPPINFGDAPATAGSEMPLSPSSTTVMASIENGNIVRARRLNFGKFEDFSPQEAEQMLSGLPDRQATQSGNVMAMISEGKIIKSQQLSPWVAEQLIATMSGSAPGQVTVPVSGQATYVPAPGSPPVTVPVFGQAKISPTIVEKPVTPVSGEAKFFTGQEPAVVNGQRTPLQGTASQQVAGSSVITQQATVTVSGMTPGFQAAPIQTTPASTVPVHGFHPNIPQVYDETLPTVHTTPHVLPMIPETLPDTSERIVASVSDGKIVGAQKIVNGRTVQVDPIYAESALATAPSQAALQSGTIMMSMVDGKVQDTKPLTPAEAQYVVATATVGDAGQAVPYTTPGLQQFGGSQTSQIVSSSQVNNYQTTTPSIGQQVLQPSEKIMMTIDEGKVVGAVQLKNGESTQIPASEAEKMLAVSGQPGQKSGNVMLTVSEGAVLDTQQVTPREAETIVSTLTAQPDPTAETIMVRFVNGQVVGAEKTFREQASTLSAPEAQMLLSSVPNQPTPQTGNILLIKSEGRIVESQELTSTEADTIMTTVFKKAPQQSLIQQQPQFASVTQTQPAFPSVPIVTQQQDRIVVTVADGKVTGAKDLKTGQQKQLSPIEAQQIMASAPAGTAQQTGNIMVTVTDGKIAESKPVTQREAETIASVVAEQSDPTAEKVVVSVERGQVVGKRVGKDKATPLSPQEAAQLWRSVAQPGQQTGDVVVSLKQGQIVGSQQLTPTEAETIKAVVVEEPKPTVCVTSDQPAFSSVVPTPSTFVSTEPIAAMKPVTSEKIIVNVANGKVSGAKHLRPGDLKDLSPTEAQEILTYVPVQKPGNVILTVADGNVVETKRVTEVEAENIMSLVSEDITPDAEKAIVTLEGGEIVGQRIGKDKTTPLSPREAEELWRSVSHPGQISGDVMVSLSEGKIVKSQQLTPTEAETIKVVVEEKAKPTVKVSSGLDRAPGQDIRGSETLMATIVDGKVVGARKLTDGVTTQVSTAEAEEIISSVPGQSSQTGHVLATISGNEVVEVQQLTPKDAEEITITGTIPRAIGTAPGEKVLLTVAGGRVAEAQKVGLRTLTPLSPTEGQKLLESASSKTKEPGDIAVTIVDGKVVGSRWVSSKLGSTQVDGSVPTGETAVIRKVVMTPSGERVVQEVVAPKDAPASEMALSGDYGKRVKVEVLEGRAAMKEFLAGSSTDSDTDAYMTPRSDQSDAYVSASSDAYVTPPSERSDAYVTPPGEPMDYSGAPEEQDGKSWFAQVTDKVTSAFFSPGTEGDVKVTEGTVPVESSIERSTSAEDIFVDAEQGRPVAAMDVSASAGFDKGPRPLQIGQIREETVVPSVQPGREPTESDEGRPKQRTVSEVARAVIPPVSVKTGEMKTEPQFFGQGEVQETAIRPEHVGTDEPVKTRRTTSDLAEEIIGPLANSASPQKGDVFFTEVPESEEAARKKRTELEYFRQVSLESEDAAEMTPEVLAELKERAAEDDTRKSSRVSFSTGPPEVIGTTEDDEDRRKPIATITMEKTEKTPVGDVKLAPAAKVAGKEPGKPTWNKVWPEKHENLPADVTTMETVEVEEYQLAPGVGRAGAVPAFTKKLTTMLAKEGSTFEAAVRVSGDPQPDITWYHHDKPLKPTDKLDIVKDKGYSSLVFMEVLPQHAGLYSCVATNVMGKATSRAPLVITGEDEAPALPPRLIDENDDRALPNQLQPAVSAGRGRTDSSSVSSVEPDVPDVNARDAKSAVVKELKEYQATSPIFKTPPFKRSKEELEGGVTMVTPTVDGEKVSPGKVEITTPASKVAGVSVDSKAEVTTPQAEVTTPTGGVGIEAVRLPSGSALPAPVKPEKKKSGLKKMFSGRKKKDKDAKKGTPTSGKAVVTPDTKPAEGEDEVFSPAVTLGAEVKPGEGQKAPSTEETVLTISTTEKKSSLTRGTARPGDLPVAIGEVVWAEPGKGATPKGSAGRTPSAELKTPTGGRTPSGELRTPSTGGRTPSAEELGSPTAVSAEKKKTGWSKFKRTFSVKKKKEKKSSSSSSSIDRIPYEQRQAYASGSLPRSAEKYSELSRSTSATMPVRPISMVSPGERPDLSRASLRTSSSTSSASSNKDKKETRPYSYAGHLDFDPRSPGYHQQRPDLPFVEAEVLPAGGTKAVAGVAASERNGKAEDSDDTETGATLSSKVVASSPSPVLTSSSIVTSSSTFVTSSSKFVSSSTTETVTVSGEEKAGTAGAKLPTSVSAPTGFGAGPASGTGGATLTATVSRTSVATTASRASVALEDSEDSAREATDNFPKYLGGKKKYRKKKGQKQQCKQQ